MIARLRSPVPQGIDAVACELQPHVADLAEVFAVAGKYDVDCPDVRVQESAERALTVAAAATTTPS